MPHQAQGAGRGSIPAGLDSEGQRTEQEREHGHARTRARDGARPDHLVPIKKVPYPPPEHCSREGARRLAQRLERYWHMRGYWGARFWIEPINERFPKVGTYELYRVACNLVNALPPRYP